MFDRRSILGFHNRGGDVGKLFRADALERVAAAKTM
jgi:hypothetical protein